MSNTENNPPEQIEKREYLPIGPFAFPTLEEANKYMDDAEKTGLPPDPADYGAASPGDPRFPEFRYEVRFLASGRFSTATRLTTIFIELSKRRPVLSEDPVLSQNDLEQQ